MRFNNKFRGRPRDNGKQRRPSSRPNGAVKKGKDVEENNVASNHSAKNRIRDILRLLNKRTDMDPKIRAAKMEEVETLRESMKDRKTKEKERTLAIRYHKVRFMERVKVERILKQVLRQKEEKGGAWTNEDEERLVAAKNDLLYIRHFPKGEKYVSLLKNAETPEAQAELEERRQRLRLLVQKQLAEAAVLAEANEGASHGETLKALEVPATKKAAPEKKEKESESRKRQRDDSDSSEDDEGDDEEAEESSEEESEEANEEVEKKKRGAKSKKKRHDSEDGSEDDSEDDSDGDSDDDDDEGEEEFEDDDSFEESEEEDDGAAEERNRKRALLLGLDASGKDDSVQKSQKPSKKTDGAKDAEAAASVGKGKKPEKVNRKEVESLLKTAAKTAASLGAQQQQETAIEDEDDFFLGEGAAAAAASKPKYKLGEKYALPKEKDAAANKKSERDGSEDDAEDKEDEANDDDDDDKNNGRGGYGRGGRFPKDGGSFNRGNDHRNGNYNNSSQGGGAWRGRGGQTGSESWKGASGGWKKGAAAHEGDGARGGQGWKGKLESGYNGGGGYNNGGGGYNNGGGGYNNGGGGYNNGGGYNSGGGGYNNGDGYNGGNGGDRFNGNTSKFDGRKTAESGAFKKKFETAEKQPQRTRTEGGRKRRKSTK